MEKNGFFHLIYKYKIKQKVMKVISYIFRNNFELEYVIDNEGILSTWNSEFMIDDIEADVILIEGEYDENVKNFVENKSLQRFLSTITVVGGSFRNKKSVLKKLVDKQKNYIEKSISHRENCKDLVLSTTYRNKKVSAKFDMETNKLIYTEKVSQSIIDATYCTLYNMFMEHIWNEHQNKINIF